MTAYFFYGLQPNVSEEVVDGAAQNIEPTIFKISKGEGLKEISARLSSQSLIKSITVFKLYSLLTGKAQKFQPGIHELRETMSVPQVVNLLTTRGKNEVTVTIPEGTTFKDIDGILRAAGVIEKGALINYSFDELADNYPFLAQVTSLEGFIFPDTYRFEVDSGIDRVVERFLDNFKIKAWSLLQTEKNWYDFLILASFLEREVPDFNDRQVVAGILLKRLRLGIPLQVDATVSYFRCGGELKECSQAVVTRKDLTLSSPYNTYQRLGWTPTPIANPGQSAISAALNSQASPYLYYLSAKETKETIFSRTLEEHNRNRVRYL
ncbi:MAG: endolytic transglycosylase MltG [Patescibacteria group bacterium]|nr:endolytic transglycosylase MltG [Patescibacteria group bacterium]